MMIYNKKCIFVLCPSSGPELLKPILNDESDQGVFCYVNKMTFGPAPKDGGWLPGDPTELLEGWNFQSHPPTPYPKRRGAGG